MNRNEFFQALPVTKLLLRLTDAALEIRTDDIEDIHLMVSGANAAQETLRISESAGVLTLEQPLSAMPRAVAASSWIQIIIRLPRTWKGAIEARSLTGWMDLHALTGTDLSLDTISGRIMAIGLDFITLGIRTVTGDVKLNEAHCDRCSLFSASGILTAMRTSLHSGTASSVTGLITLDLVAPFAELTLNTVSGDLCVDAPITECDAVLRSVSGRIRTSGISIVEGTPRLRAATVSGDLDMTSNIE